MSRKNDESSQRFAVSLGALLKREREKKGIKQLDLAKQLGHNNAVTVCKYERGAMTPTSYMLYLIAQILEITIELNPHANQDNE